MNADEARTSLKEVTKKLENVSVNDYETKKQLREELRLLFDRLKELK